MAIPLPPFKASSSKIGTMAEPVFALPPHKLPS